MATVVSKIGKIVRFPDLRVENHGSIFLLRSRTEVGETFIEDHAPEDAQYFGDALVVEPRYVENWVDRARDAGLEVR